MALLPLAWLLAAASLPAADPVPSAPDARGNGLPVLSPHLGNVKLKHDNMIIAAAFAPDSKTAATGGWDNMVRRWDVATGKELGRFTGHEKPVYGVAFTPDGKQLASASEDRTIRLWDIKTGKTVRRFDGHEGGVTRVSFTPDGQRLASSSYDQTVRVWDTATGKELHKLGGQQRGFTAVVVSPDGKYVATGAADFSVRLLELATGKEAKLFRGHTSSIIGIAFSPDGRLLATGSEDSTVRLWNVTTGRQTRQLTGAGGVWAVAFAPDGRYLASAGRDKRLRVWEVVTGSPLRTAEGHTDGIPTLDFSPDARLLLSGSHDTTAMLWDWSQGKPAERLATNLGSDDLAACWNLLAGSDAVAAQRAVWQMTAAMPQSVPFLHRRLRPAEGIDAERLAQLVSDLDSNVFKVRQKATNDLQELGDQAETVLRSALEGRPSPEMKQRVDRLLGKIDSSGLKPEQLQVLRALEVLERSGSAEARQILEEMAKGSPGTRPTEEARAVIQRMKAGKP
jgi:dipeptidyl aminopeptidase/acylaminoacyl peptidase